MAKYIFRCTECGSTKVQIKCWVNPNTNEVIDECYNPWRECWCENCGVQTEFECVEVKEMNKK